MPEDGIDGEITLCDWLVHTVGTMSTVSTVGTARVHTAGDLVHVLYVRAVVGVRVDAGIDKVSQLQKQRC